MDPPSKRRRLAPKVPDPPPASGAPAVQPAHPSPSFPAEQQPAPDATPPVERHDFESFARHLQDAAMLIYRQTQKSPYTSVSVLLLRWEEDTSVEHDMNALEAVLRERYNYHTDKWAIPTVPNPSIKLGIQMASFIENARPDHLLIIYYAGHGFVGPDNHLYWACNSQGDACKLKWDGVRCLFEDAQSDILLLLDTCGTQDAPLAGSHGVKQAIAAYSPEQSLREVPNLSFTASLVESLHKLSTTGRSFSVQRLFDEVRTMKPQGSPSRMTNGVDKAHEAEGKERLPVFSTLTAGKGHPGLSLAPLNSQSTHLPSPIPSSEGEGLSTKTSRDDSLISPDFVVDLTFDEARVLVCTTFVGDASPDMSFFKEWIHHTPPLASHVAVEGMFLGPPTMLLISMPQSIWNVVQHDKVCCFLGYISSHNMIHLYQKLVGSAAMNAASAREVEDGRILLEAREAAATTSPPKVRNHVSAHSIASYPETPVRPDGVHRGERTLLPNSAGQHQSTHATSNQSSATRLKHEVEDSAEMQEAAEQLSALSHNRHLSDGTPSAVDHLAARLVKQATEKRNLDKGSATDGNEESAIDESRYSGDLSVLSAKPKTPRRPLTKQFLKDDARCHLCTHAPFKDSSSLRKHIAAAHTRPFPCAFSFAGCTSTFGSKNEWKRHIASQHLCLTYYHCSACPQSTVEGKGNEFNRKDLFTQHLRRMHAPFDIKKSTAKVDSKTQAEWDNRVKDLQQSCLVIRRRPPQRSACPKEGCQIMFEGPTSWDEWTEHVGRHMEKDEGHRLGVDNLLAEWALDENIVEQVGDGEYRLCSGNGTGDKEGNSSSIFVADGIKQAQDADDANSLSITVAFGGHEGDRMEVD